MAAESAEGRECVQRSRGVSVLACVSRGTGLVCCMCLLENQVLLRVLMPVCLLSPEDVSREEHKPLLLASDMLIWTFDCLKLYFFCSPVADLHCCAWYSWLLLHNQAACQAHMHKALDSGAEE